MIFDAPVLTAQLFYGDAGTYYNGIGGYPLGETDEEIKNELLNIQYQIKMYGSSGSFLSPGYYTGTPPGIIGIQFLRSKS